MRRLFLLTLALIVYWSLYPWQFRFGSGLPDPLQTLAGSWPRRLDTFAFHDALGNVLLYFPLGACVYFLVRRRLKTPAATILALIAGLILSAILELTQAYVPGRVPSLFDILCNVAGSAAGALVSRRFAGALENAAHKGGKKLGSPAALLLGCWLAYYLYPFWPSLSFRRVSVEIHFLLHPISFLPGEIWSCAAEWFTAAFAIRSLFGHLRYSWIIGAVCLHILVVRPLFLTRLLERDEIIGVILALLLWRLLPERFRLPAGLVMMAGMILARGLVPGRFSTLPSDFSPGAALLRKAFGYGSMVWLLHCGRAPYAQAAATLVTAIAACVGIQYILVQRQPAVMDLIVAVVAALSVWVWNRYGILI